MMELTWYIVQNVVVVNFDDDVQYNLRCHDSFPIILIGLS